MRKNCISRIFVDFLSRSVWSVWHTNTRKWCATAEQIQLNNFVHVYNILFIFNFFFHSLICPVTLIIVFIHYWFRVKIKSHTNKHTGGNVTEPSERSEEEIEREKKKLENFWWVRIKEAQCFENIIVWIGNSESFDRDCSICIWMLEVRTAEEKKKIGVLC